MTSAAAARRTLTLELTHVGHHVIGCWSGAAPMPRWRRLATQLLGDG